MPEYPEIVVYIERLLHVARGRQLQRVRIAHPFLLRTADPPIESLEGQVLESIERIGKRIVFAFADECFLVLHLMISGRLDLRDSGSQIPRRRGLAALDFSNGFDTPPERPTTAHAVRRGAGCAPIRPCRDC